MRSSELIQDDINQYETVSTSTRQYWLLQENIDHYKWSRRRQDKLNDLEDEEDKKSNIEDEEDENEGSGRKQDEGDKNEGYRRKQDKEYEN